MVQRSFKLFFIRHGEDKGSQMNKFGDYALTINGEAQIHKLTEKLNQYNITMVFSSPLKRANQSAEIIAKHFGLTISTDEDLKERDVGLVNGMTYTEVQEKYSVLLKKSVFDKDFKFPDGESSYDVYERAGKFLNKIIHKSAGTSEGIVIVSHPLILNYLIYQLLEIGFRDVLLFAYEPAYMSIFELQEDFFQMIKFSN